MSRRWLFVFVTGSWLLWRWPQEEILAQRVLAQHLHARPRQVRGDCACQHRIIFPIVIILNYRGPLLLTDTLWGSLNNYITISWLCLTSDLFRLRGDLSRPSPIVIVSVPDSSVTRGHGINLTLLPSLPLAPVLDTSPHNKQYVQVRTWLQV